MRWLLFVVLGVGCGEEAEEQTPPIVHEEGCPAGTLAREDGSCQPAGVPAELCAPGFVHDGDAGCEPILPAETCPKGQLAIPGDESCHTLVPCGTGVWGDIPIDGASIHVSAQYSGGDGDGSIAKPFTRIAEAIAAAPAGSLIAVAAGSYAEDIVLAKRVRLVGVCPERVELLATGDAVAALWFREGASGSELRGFAVTGNAHGILVSDAENVVIEQVWVHDAEGRGLNIEDTAGPTSVILRELLVEQNHEAGVFVAGAPCALERSVVRGTAPRASDQQLGRGIGIQDNTDTGTRAQVVVHGSVIENNHDTGVYVLGSDVTVEGVVVRGTMPQASDGEFGRGIAIQRNPVSSQEAKLTLASSLVDQNHDQGVTIAGSVATLEGVVVRRTMPRASNQEFGRGINVVPGFDGGAATTQVKSSLVEHNHEFGIAVASSQATLEGVLVRRTWPRGSEQWFGEGIAIQATQTSHALPNVTISGSVVEESYEAGVLVMGGEITIEALLVRNTHAGAGDGLFGDGLVVASFSLEGTPLLANSAVTRSRIERNARAGIGNLGAHIALRDTELSCNAVDLAGGVLFDLPFSFEDFGGNRCGCPEPAASCAVRDSTLSPPKAVSE